jgi:hypothetical protein
MPAGTVAPAAPVSAGSAGGIPFLFGSNQYTEQMFTDTYTLSAAGTQEFVHQITPGGFLRGVRLLVTSSGGVIGSGVLAADAPWNLFSSISLENIDGSPILYPINGFAAMAVQKYFRSWEGDPAKRNSYTNGVNPSFELFIKPELRDTAGVLANTDARALYRLRYTIASGATVFPTAPTTYPTVTVVGMMESWSQPDQQDLHGNSIAQIPPGINCAHIVRHQIATLNSAGADNLVQLQNVGNEIRAIAFILRDSNNNRQDYISTPFRLRIDQRSLMVATFQEIVSQMSDFYDFLQVGTSARETGVFVLPRYRRPGDMIGQYWLPTSNATYLTFETSTPAGAANLPGTIEVLTSEVVAVGNIPGEFEGI